MSQRTFEKTFTDRVVMILRAAFCVMVFAVYSPAFADEHQERHIAGIYSNLHYIEEAGDLVGTELHILPPKGDDKAGYTVVVQIAEGEAPFTATVPLKVSGDRFEFTLPKDSFDPGAHFTGKFDQQGLTLKWSSGTVEHLKRGKSYWQHE